MDAFTLSGSELGYLTLGIVFVAIGSITLFLTVLRAASRDAAILLFGAMSLVWGLRFLLYTRLVPDLLGVQMQILERLARAMTYWGAAAAFGFAWAFLGKGWRKSLCLLSLIGLGFAGVASVVLAAHPDRDLLLPTFSVIVIAGTVTILGNLCHPELRRQPRLQGLVVGSAIGIVFIVLENLRSLNVAPVPFDVEWIGVLIIYVTLGRLIARRLFTNERRLALIDQELATARRIQAAILPDRTPLTPELTLAARYLPMTAVAGDIYDFLTVDEHRQGILMADVSGHGVPAALIASMVKVAFRAQIEFIDRPERVLAGMNKILTGQLEQQFVTAGCAFVDAEAGILRYGGAGHPPLLIQPGDGGDCIPVEENGLMLGQFPDASYTSIERSLAARDRLILYTDGILEAENSQGEEFGDRSLRAFLRERRDLSAEHFADALLAAVTAWAGASRGETLDDDLTLIVVDVLAGSEPRTLSPAAAQSSIEVAR